MTRCQVLTPLYFAVGQKTQSCAAHPFKCLLGALEQRLWKARRLWQAVDGLSHMGVVQHLRLRHPEAMLLAQSIVDLTQDCVCA